jgi:hypothetical protein
VPLLHYVHLWFLLVSVREAESASSVCQALCWIISTWSQCRRQHQAPCHSWGQGLTVGVQLSSEQLQGPSLLLQVTGGAWLALPSLSD